MKTSDMLFFLPLISLYTVNIVALSYDKSAVLRHLLLVKTGRSLEVDCRFVQFLFSSYCTKFHIQTSGWT